MNLESRKNDIQNALAALHSNEELKDGRFSALERMGLLLDEGSFVETNAFIGADGETEGVVTGYGAVSGRLVFAWVQDYSRSKGALGVAGAKKIAALYAEALKNGAPVAAVFDSDGMKLNEGVNALAACGIILKAAASAKFKIPRISLIAGVCSGASAACALQSDFLITAGKNASMSLSPVSALIENGAKAEAGSGEYNESFGIVSVAAGDEKQAFAYARTLLDYLPSNNGGKLVYIKTSDSAERVTPEIENIIGETYDMRTLLAAIADDGKYIEVNAAYGTSFITAIASFAGAPCGIIATNPAVNGGKITSHGANKASHFLDICAVFGLPVITLADCAGYDAADETAKGDIARKIARLSGSYAKAASPVITVITGKVSGSAFAVLGSKMLGADLVLALPSAQIEVMEAEAAVNFLWNDKLAQAESAEAARAELKEKWAREASTPLEAARKGYIDFICPFEELRARVISGISMLTQKNRFKF